MMFFDRLILANYSLDAMNAAAAAGMACMVFQYGAIGIASIAEVFTGQLNGAKKFTQTAQPSWQMVWFSLLTFPLFFFFIANDGAPFILSDYHYEDHGLPYFQWLLYFGPIFSIQAALSAFYIGIGKVRLVMASAVLSNMANVILDFLLVFGFSSFFPSLGTKGASFFTGG